jgi:ATP-binding cassette, subfamily C, bacterial CydC
MTGMNRTLRRLLGDEAAARLLAPAAMVVLAFAVGAAMLGLAGWFIAASAVAGLAVSSSFSFLFPSAEVQALAWARTLARYGERISTHHATLRLVGSLRTSLFARAMQLPRDRAAELRSSELLGRITVDSDAVQNLLLGASFPFAAALAALLGAAVFFALVSLTLMVICIGGLLRSWRSPVGKPEHRRSAWSRRAPAPARR